MKKTIRKSVFETNSSSTHSISLSNTPKDIKLNYNGDVLVLEGGEFGWEVEEYTDWLTKANYAAVATEGEHCKGQRKWLIEVLSEKLNCSEVIFKLDGSYIDHQSDSVLLDSVTSKEEMYQFIFCNSILRTDNDNH